MLRLIIVDEKQCKKELNRFVEQNKKFLYTDVTTKELAEKINLTCKTTDPKNRIALNTKDHISLVCLDNIVRFEAKRNYSIVFLKNNLKTTISKTLQEFDRMLEEKGFVRIHKTHLINLDCLDKYLKRDGGYALMCDGSLLPVSVRKKESFLKKLNQL